MNILKSWKCFLNVHKRYFKAISVIMTTCGITYYLRKSINLQNFNISRIKICALAKTSTEEKDHIDSMNIVAKMVECVTPGLVHVCICGVCVCSGVIVDKNGYILANAHEIYDKPFLSVRLHNDENYKAEIIACNKMLDLALIKINPGNLKLNKLDFADETKLNVGEYVIAVNSVNGFLNSVMFGVISNVELDKKSQCVKFIFSDALNRISNFFVGGPLLNLCGEIIGFNSIRTPQLYGLASSSIFCQKFVQEEINNYATKELNIKLSKNQNQISEIEHGIYVSPVTKDFKLDYLTYYPITKESYDNKVYIYSVSSKSSAHKAGLLDLDVIETVDGNIIYSTSDFIKYATRREKVNISIIRHGKSLKLKDVNFTADHEKIIPIDEFVEKVLRSNKVKRY